MKSVARREQPVYEELYSKKDKFFERKVRDKREIEFEKQREQCTFKPDLDKSLHNNKLRGAAQSVNVSPIKKHGSYAEKYRKDKDIC